MKQGLPGQFFMPKSICEGTWGVCARVYGSVCVCVWDRLTLSVTQEEKQEKALED